jgi:hypothetical protein
LFSFPERPGSSDTEEEDAPPVQSTMGWIGSGFGLFGSSPKRATRAVDGEGELDKGVGAGDDEGTCFVCIRVLELR